MRIVFTEMKLPDILLDSIRTGGQDYEGLSLLPFGFLKAVLNNDRITRDVQVDILDTASFLHRLEMIRDEVISRQPDLIGMSVYVWNYYRTLKLCELIKNEYPQTKIVLGGPQVSFLSTKVLQDHPYVDGIVRGEGEITFLELVRSMLKGTTFGKNIQGLTYRNDSRIIENPTRPLLDDLNKIPSPYLTKTLDMSKIPKLELETSRGCLFRCTYCVWCELYHKIRFFSEKRVIDELKMAVDYGIDNVVFYDAIFSVPHIIRKLCKRIAEEKIKISFDAFLRPELVNDKMLDILEKAGMRSAEIGVQSFNPETLRRINRPTHIGKIKESFDLVHRRGIQIICDMIIGLPAETYESAKKGIDTAHSFKGTTVRTFILQLLPGSQLWNKSKELGLEYQHDPPYLITSTPTFSRDEIVEMIQYGFSKPLSLTPDALAKLILEGKNFPKYHSHTLDPLLGG
jgi:radical SAM superfamily enzyme YgiQ (UPF0313 family)